MVVPTTSQQRACASCLYSLIWNAFNASSIARICSEGGQRSASVTTRADPVVDHTARATKRATAAHIFVAWLLALAEDADAALEKHSRQHVGHLRKERGPVKVSFARPRRTIRPRAPLLRAFSLGIANFPVLKMSLRKSPQESVSRRKKNVTARSPRTPYNKSAPVKVNVIHRILPAGTEWQPHSHLLTGSSCTDTHGGGMDGAGSSFSARPFMAKSSFWFCTMMSSSRKPPGTVPSCFCGGGGPDDAQ